MRDGVCSRCGHKGGVRAFTIGPDPKRFDLCEVCDPHRAYRRPIVAECDDPIARATNAARGIDPDQAPGAVVG